ALHDGGAGTYVLGIFLHFFIALSVATIYYAASRRLRFLIEHPLVCGLFYGAAVDQIMTLIVLPLSALHAAGPYKLHDLLLGLIVHSVVLGLPISFRVRRFARWCLLSRAPLYRCCSQLPPPGATLAPAI